MRSANVPPAHFFGRPNFAKRSRPRKTGGLQKTQEATRARAGRQLRENGRAEMDTWHQPKRANSSHCAACARARRIARTAPTRRSGALS